jgi:cellulose synthase/poly-beta-1,6-N-acetylglucosamine synthase-like glycosyltransferase
MATALVFALFVPLLVVNLVFVAETTFGLRRGDRRQWGPHEGRTVIIVPAHNEAAILERSLTALIMAAGDDFEILVVADNCNDDTAEIARRLSVDVVERHDSTRRGKGHALAYARERMRTNPPRAVIILDADCRTEKKSLTSLASASQQLQTPVQAVYLLEPTPSSGSLVQLSCFAFVIKNLVRQRGLQRLARRVHLTGTGMSLPWELFNTADLATSSIVEDMKLGIEMSRRGADPRLIEESIVWSAHAEESHTIGQRSRWEGGFLALARATAPGLIAEAIRTLSPRSLLAALDLLVPPLALLTILNVAALLLLVVLAVIGATSWLPAGVLGGISVTAAVVLMFAWVLEGRAFLTPAAMVRLPLYVLWKIPMYLRIVRSGAPKVWQRTERADETGHGAAPPSA